MNFKKTAFAMLLVCSSSSIFANELSIGNNNMVGDIASAILQEVPINNGQNFKILTEQAKISDEKINQHFNTLSVQEKYKVLEIVRNANLRKSDTEQTKEALLLKHAIKDVIKTLKSQDVFIGDIGDSELKLYIADSLASLKTDDSIISEKTVSVKSSSSCPLKNFYDSIDYAVKPSYTSYASAYYYSNVVTTVGEWPCDTELWYNASKNNVYGLNWSTRQMITIGYGGRLSKRISGGNDRLVVGIKKYIWGLSDYALSKNVIIW